MSTLNTTNLKNPSSGSNNIVLGTDGATTLGTAKVTAIADSAGANSSTPEAIANGTCKAWVNFNGTANTNLSGTYSQSGTTVTVTATAHGLIAGNTVYSDITSGTAVDGTYTVATVTDANTFTYTAGTSLTTSGNITLIRNTIRASYNVSSITDNGTGDYTVNFTTALVDANYSVIGTSNNSSDSASNTGYGASVSIRSAAAPTTSAVRVYTINLAASSTASQIVTAVDQAYMNIAIFR